MTVTPGIDPFDLGHRRVVGAVPSIDRLARVADQTDVGTSASPRLEQRVLQRVEVLRLVDEEVTESPMNQRCGMPCRFRLRAG